MRGGKGVHGMFEETSEMKPRWVMNSTTPSTYQWGATWFSIV